MVDRWVGTQIQVGRYEGNPLPHANAGVVGNEVAIDEGRIEPFK